MSDLVANLKFQIAVELVLKREGKLSEDVRDDGGTTKFGISQRAYPQLDIRNLTLDQAIGIYRRDYWDRTNCGALPMSLGLVLFDGAVNHGQVLAAKLLQRVLKVREDGVIGPQTLAALGQRRLREVIEHFMAERGLIYLNHPDRSWAGRGWMRRLAGMSMWSERCLQLP